MKLTKRMQNALLQGLILNIIFFGIFLAIFFLKVYPNIQSIEGKKQELQAFAQTLTQIQKSGLSFEEFKQSLSEAGLLQDSYISGILRNIDTFFYEEHFKNTTEADYQTFLKQKESELIAKKNTPEFKEKNTTINTILPFYTGNKNTQEISVNDVYFINYVESILYNFNLDARGDIGVGELEKVDESLSDSSQQSIPGEKNALQEDIYKIPLSFEVNGRKSDILDFIHFFENVGAVKVENDQIQVYTDKVLSQVLSDTIPEGNYNIYKNQIATIHEIQLPKYPDSSTFASQGGYTNLVDTIRFGQSKEALSLNIVLHFYVSGLPLYKLDESIKKMQEDIGTLKQKLQVAQNNVSQGGKNQDILVSQKLSLIQSLTDAVQELENEITSIGATLSQDTSVDAFEKISQYRKQFSQIQNLFDSKIQTIQ